MGNQESRVYKQARIGHRIDWDNIEILDTPRDRIRLLLKVMLHINKLKPQLNVLKSSKLFSLIIGVKKNIGKLNTKQT